MGLERADRFIHQVQWEYREREVEVLRLLARGHSKKQIAQLLVLSPKTVDQHTQHINNKIAVSTRAAATLFAIEHDLLADGE